MELIRENKAKGRSVFFDGTHYIKVWNNQTPKWISEHVRLLKDTVPGYVVDYGGNWISYNIVPGVPASTFNHTDDFIRRIHNFCLENIKSTQPYVHGDWTLSNILVDGDTLRMCDWDNLGIYPTDSVLKKLEEDLASAFGKEKYLNAIKDDSTSI